MWKLYLFSVLIAARVCLHTCDPASTSSIFDFSQAAASLCPPKLPLLDLFEYLPQSSLSLVKVWVNTLAQQYPQALKVFMLLGILQLLAENLLLVYAAYYVTSRVLTGIAKSICWLLVLSLCVLGAAYYIGQQYQLIVWTRYIVSEVYKLLHSLQTST